MLINVNSKHRVSEKVREFEWLKQIKPVGKKLENMPIF